MLTVRSDTDYFIYHVFSATSLSFHLLKPQYIPQGLLPNMKPKGINEFGGFEVF